MKVLLFLFFLLFSVQSFAETKLSFMGTLSINNIDRDNEPAGFEDNPMLGYGIGLRALMGINNQFYFRSGAGLINKRVEYEVRGGEGTINLMYLQLPLTFYWKASPQVGFFGGTAIHAKLDDDCDGDGNQDGCTVKDDSALVFPLIVGFDFNFTDIFGMEVSYEYGLNESYEDTQIHSAVASFLVHF